MNCDECRRQLLRFVHGEPCRAQEVARHLSGCVSCHKAAESEKALWEALGEFDVETQDIDLLPRVRAAVQRRRIPWIAPAAAVLLAAVALAGLWPSRPAPRRWIATNPQDVRMDLHAEAGGPVPAHYPYIEGYDRAVAEGGYVAFVDGLPEESVTCREVAPGHRLYSTPRGSLSLFEEKYVSGGRYRHTVLRNGREFKIISLVEGSTRVTLVSDRLPWPEIDVLAERALSKGD